MWFLSGCSTAQTVNRAEFEQLKAHWHEPKVTVWYYMGSKDGFHYFHHDDLGKEPKDFRISDAELPWDNQFPLTGRRSKWRSLLWGPYENLERARRSSR